MLNPSTGFAMHLVLSLLLGAQAPLTTPFAVRNEGAGALVAAVGDDRGPRQARSITDSVNARQSLRLPGSGIPIATTRRLSASMTTCRFVECR